MSFKNVGTPFTFQRPKSVSGKIRKVTSRRQAMTEVGAVSVDIPVVWGSFFTDPHTMVQDHLKESDVWNIIPSKFLKKPVGSYIAALRAGWLVGILVKMISMGSGGRIVHVVNFAADIRRIDNEFIRYDLPALQKIQYNPVIAHIFLVVFISHGEEAVATIFVENGRIEVMMPFPRVWKQSKLMQKLMCSVVNTIRRDWMGLPNTPDCTQITDVFIYKMAPHFEESNIWNTYILMKRFTNSFNDTQAALLGDASQLDRMLIEGVHITRQLVQSFTTCLYSVATGPTLHREVAFTLHNELYSKNATQPAVLTDQVYDILINLMNVCPLSKILIETPGQDPAHPAQSASIGAPVNMNAPAHKIIDDIDFSRFIAPPGAAPGTIIWVAKYDTETQHPAYMAKATALAERFKKITQKSKDGEKQTPAKNTAVDLEDAEWGIGGE